MGKRTQMAKNTKKWSFFITLNTSPCQPCWQNTRKSIGDTTECDFFIILCSFNITHPLTCPKTLEKGRKRLKTFKGAFFISFGTLPCQLRSQIKKNWTPNYMWHSYHSCNFNRSHSLTFSKNSGKEFKQLKIPKNGHFSQVLALLPANLDPKAKRSPSVTQLHVTFLSFHAILL